MRRWWVQLLASVGQNAWLPGFLTGRLYSGNLKKVCVPGLNCWSCPGAVGACPIGAAQGVSASAPFSLGLLPWGFLVLFGGIFGRFVCGWLCPFGFFQDLLHKLPGRKGKLPRALRWPKYFILLVFVLLLPIVSVYGVGIGETWYCKYLCPAGTLEAGIPLLLLIPPLRQAIGLLFYWRLLLLAVTLLLAAYFYRFFCHCLCPLGAFYSLFNRFSLVRIHWQADRCTSCGKCRLACRSGLDPTRELMSPECIVCGECVRQCPEQALAFSPATSKKAALHN
jgi:polyferredoxin